MEYINEAIEVEKKGLKIKPEKFKPVDLPEILKEAFNTNSDLEKAFKKLTPGKQKEHILFISEAKQEATKLKRIAKISPMILAGKGLYDKYK